MKYLLLLCLALFTLSTYAAGIYGLDNVDIQRLNLAFQKCDKPLVNYSKLHVHPNKVDEYLKGEMNLQYGLIHNFIITVGPREVLNLRDSAVVSGLFYVEPGGVILLDGAVIGNMTFRGDMTGVSMVDACVVRTNFAQTQNLGKSEILNKTRFTKDLELPQRSLKNILLGEQLKKESCYERPINIKNIVVKDPTAKFITDFILSSKEIVKLAVVYTRSCRWH